MAKATRVDLRAFQQELAARLQTKTAAQVGAARLGVVSGGEQWLIRLADAGEVVAVPTLSSVPLTKIWFLGVANIRGGLYSVIDFASFLGRDSTPQGLHSRLLLLGPRYSELRAALLLQRLLGLRNLSEMKRVVGASSDLPKHWEWVGDTWEDQTGGRWRELDVTKLAQSAAFLKVGL